MTINYNSLPQGIVQKYVQTSLVQNGAPPAAAADPPIQTARWARQNKHPNSILESMKGSETNSVALFRGKEVFRYGGYFPQPIISHGATATSGSFTRWRGAFHTGPFTQYVDVVVQMAASGNSFATNDAYGQFVLNEFPSGAQTTVETFPSGAIAQVSGDYFSFPSQPLTRRVVVKPDTSYTFAFSDNKSSMMGANIREVCSLTAFRGGYAPMNHAVTGPILSGFRQNEAEVTAAIWRHGAAHLFNWTVEDSTLPLSTSTNQLTNLLEASEFGAGTTLGSTTITDNTLGFKIDGTKLVSRRQARAGSGFGVVLAAFGQSTLAAGGQVSIVGQKGGPVASLAEVWGTTASWQMVNSALPAIDDKYDVRFGTVSSETFKVYAVALWQYET